jgi:hypothetical protein
VRDQILGAVRDAESKFEVKVSSVVTDGASNMVLGRNLAKALGPRYLLYSCQAHVLQLLVKDYLKGKEAIVNNVVAVLKSFRTVHALASALVSRNLGRPPLPCPTRWGSMTRALRYWNQNWAPLVQIAAQCLPPNDSQAPTTVDACRSHPKSH